MRKESKNRNEFYNLNAAEQKERLKEIALIFFKLGTTAFGGPAAHIAMMDDEIVKKRKWLSEEKFLDLYGATNLLPGPNSTELAIHIGYERGGWLGLILAGSCFIIPAMVIVMILAIVYSSYGTLPEVSGILYGIKPVVMAIILQALYRLGKTALKNIPAAMTGIVVIFLYFIGLHELLLLAAAGLVMMLITNRKKLIKKRTTLSSFAPFLNISAFLPAALFSSVNVNVEKSVGLTRLFLIFLKIGSVLYGSGYVLLAYLESDFVQRYGLLTKQQLLDAISVGQFTPGPVFTTATFIGYLTHGFWGGILATIGIFLPAFILVGLVIPYIHKLRSSSWVTGILDGVNAASWGLMAVVSWKLGISAVIDIPTIILSVVTLLIISRYKVNTAWLVLAGGMIGYLVTYLS